MSTAFKIGEHSYDALIQKVSDIVGKISGNVLGDKQALMVQTRVKKRMSELGLHTPDEYMGYIDTHLKEESDVLVSLITTHHTFFFREYSHFEFLKETLPELVKGAKDRGDNTIKVWSAACSRGQEAYSLAMFLDYYLPKIDSTMSYQIFGSDIDVDSVKIAQNGVYHRREIKSVPMNYLGSHWARGTGEISDYVKVKKSIGEKCTFKPLNLMNFSSDMRGEKFDIVFCRNVFIYFESEQIKKITNSLFEHIHPTGVFFSGISESLAGLNLDIFNAGPSIYRHKEYGQPKTEAVTATTPVEAPTIAPIVEKLPRPLKVLSVDDSPSIITLLKKIFSDDDGFEIVATAGNGIEASEMLKKHDIDIMTLDIHMPEMDGVTYLEKNFSSSHPPVVMISSASRDDSDLAMKALRFGASDFIEKPALNNLMERGDEIKTKLKVAFLDSSKAEAHVSSIDKEFEKTIKIENPELKFRSMFASFNDKKKVVAFFKEVDFEQPPTVIFFEGQKELLFAFKDELAKDVRQKVVVMEDPSMEVKPGEIYLADFKEYYEATLKRFETRMTSILVFGKASKHANHKILEWGNAQLLIEDVGTDCELTDVATDCVPATSFAYMSTNFLSK